MSFLVFLFASGWAFFVGVALIIAAASIPKERLRRSRALVLLGAFVFIAPSSTPLPWLAYGTLLALVLWWWRDRNEHRGCRCILIAAWLIAADWEGWRQFTPHLPFDRNAPVRIAVVGDSLTAGLSETKAVKWPRVLAKRKGVDFAMDFAVEGATCRKALAQAEMVPDSVDAVVVEIGGNDVLGQTTLVEFERDYDALLVKLERPNRILVGFELPLPPFYNAWGLAQRRIAAKHGVALIPKWRLMRMLVDPANTVDSIHPTQAGQEALADIVGSVFERRQGHAPLNAIPP